MEHELDNSINVDAVVSKAQEFAKKATTSKPYTPKAVDPHRRSSKMVIKSDGSGTTNLSDVQHGTFVKDEHGNVGIVVDNDYQLRKIAENDEELKLMRMLTDDNDPLFDNLRNREKVDTVNHIDEYIAKHPKSEQALKLKEIKEAFAEWDCCAIDERGAVLAPKDSPRCKAYRAAMDAVRTGKVRLPTVDEYEKQKKEAEEKAAKAKEEAKLKKPRQPKQQVQQTKQLQQEPIPEPVKNPQEVVEPVDNTPKTRLQYNEEAQKMSESDRKAIIEQAGADPALAQASTPKPVKPKTQRVVMDGKNNSISVVNAGVDPMLEAMNKPVEAQPVTNVEATVAPPPQAKSPVLNMAEAEMAMAEIDQQPIEEEVAEASVTIEVPEAKAATFMATLPSDIKEKVETAEKVKVNFVGEVSLPNTVRRLTNVNQYRKVAPKNTGDGVTMVTLMNSGYVGYFRPVGSLEWSLLSPVQDDEGGVEYPDVGKIAQFAYNHLVSTSLGPMSYIEFCENTSYDDLNHIIYTLMRASQPDEQSVVLVCPKKTCQKEYATKYSIAALPNYSAMEDDAKAQIQKVSSVKDVIEDAKEVHEESPVMKKLVWTSKSTGTIFILKNFDISMVVDRFPVLETIRDEYGETAAILVQFTVEVYVKVDNTGDDSKDYAVSNDPSVICEEYFRLTPEEVMELEGPLGAIPRFTPIVYSMKGRHVCSHCGHALENPRQDILNLVFHMALTARYFA